MALLELTNYFSGISLSLSGTNGSDWMIERLYFDPTKDDRCVIYIRAATQISFSHNSRNVARITAGKYELIGANGLDGVADSGDEGVVRYKVDGDMHWGPAWTSKAGAVSNVNPAYAIPITFNALTYPAAQGSLSVLGRTGDNGQSQSSKLTYFRYGHDDGRGNEHHTIQVADDDWSITSTDTEWRASDGRVFHFVVEPKTPCLQVRVTGNAEFHTSPIKTYNVPKIHTQETRFTVGTGGVEFEIRDISGANVYYRINGGSYTAAGAPSVTLTDASFPDGLSTLEYYAEGQSAHVQSRTIRKNPAHPSAGEVHGYLCCGNEGNLTAMRTRSGVDPYAYHWSRLAAGTNGSGNRAAFDSAISTVGLRTYPSAAYANALLARIYDSTTAKQTSQSDSYAHYAKRMLLQNWRSVDMVGFEMDWPQNTLPTREYIYRGYYDVASSLDVAMAYDTLIAIYRSDTVAGGITPVEDYFIRDCIAADIAESVMLMCNWQGSFLAPDSGGMWDVARKCGSVTGMFAIPSYSTHYYGTCGLDGATTTYVWTPFPDYPLTWKQMFLDEDQTIRGYPNLANRLGVEGYNVVVSQTALVGYGDFQDRVSYLSFMLPVFAGLANLLKYQYPQKAMAALEAFMLKCTNGTIYGAKADSGGFRGPHRQIFLGCFNASFPACADVGIPIVTAAASNAVNSDNQLINGYMPAVMRDYEWDYESGPADPPVAPIFTTQPISATVTEGEPVTFTVVTSGNPTPTRQWRKNGTNISGQTGTSYTIASTVVGDAGIYDCVATNSVAPSGVTSAAATLVVNAIPPTPDPVTKRTNYKTPAVIIAL